MTHVLISWSLGFSALPVVGATEVPDVPPAKASEAKVPDGYHATIVVRDLTFPTSVAFGPDGAMYVAEAGYSYGEETAEPRILRIKGEDDVKVIASSGLEGPINDLLWHDDHLFVSHRGKISVVDLDGKVTDLVTGLPSEGDHHNNQLTAGPDGKIYFGQGTLTNSGVVGPDNAHMGWLGKHPQTHDVPAKDIELNNKAFESRNPLKEGDQTARTHAFHAFGEVTVDLIVKGATKAAGTILKMNPDGSDLEVHAWGLRNPYGVLWLPDGRLMVSENGMDVRGSRPVANDKEDLYQVKEGAWYGWPDFASGKPVTDPEFAPEDGPAPEFLMKNHPEVEKPVMTFPEHSSAAKMTWSSDEKFGRPNRLFVAFFGHMSPMTGKTKQHGGHRVVAIDLESKETETFFSNASHGGKKSESGHHGKESGGGGHSDGSGDTSTGGETVTAGPRRLIDVEFGPDGALYIVDFGTLVIKEGEAVPVQKTGLVWKVAHGESSDGKH